MRAEGGALALALLGGQHGDCAHVPDTIGERFGSRIAKPGRPAPRFGSDPDLTLSGSANHLRRQLTQKQHGSLKHRLQRRNILCL